MKYDLGSDLHVDINARLGMLDFATLKNEGSETLVLAGDISNDPALTLRVVSEAAQVYENVIFIDGNHEHYGNLYNGRNVSFTTKYLKKEAKKIPNISYLKGNNSVFIDGVLFVGANCWYDFKMQPSQYSFDMAKAIWGKYMNDKKLAVFDKEPEIYAEEQTNDIMKQVVDAQINPLVENIVMVSHTIPSPKGLVVKYEPIWDALNGAFGCTAIHKIFNADINKKIIHSVFGHTHYPYDFDDFDGIRFICNPRGYYGVEPQTEKWTLLQLDTDNR